MKNITFLTLIVLFLLTSCHTHPTEVHETINRTKYINVETEVIVKHINKNEYFSIVEIAGCEYILYSKTSKIRNGYGESGAGGLTHKGNCKYCLKK